VNAAAAAARTCFTVIINLKIILIKSKIASSWCLSFLSFVLGRTCDSANAIYVDTMAFSFSFLETSNQQERRSGLCARQIESKQVRTKDMYDAARPARATPRAMKWRVYDYTSVCSCMHAQAGLAFHAS
jgi:hypothetical protein